MPPPTLSQGNKVIKRKIIDAADNIRKKYLSLKLERSETDDALNKMLNPIRTPLTQIVENTSNIITNKNIKREKVLTTEKVKEEKKEMENEKHPTPNFLPTKVMTESTANRLNSGSGGDDDDDEVFSEAENHFQEDLQGHSNSYTEYPKLVRDYINLYYSKSDKIDHTYGLNHDPHTNSWKMGSERVEFLSNGDIKLGDVTYKGTRGLFELLFLKEPMYPTRSDEAQFEDILQRTNAHRRDHSQSGQIKGSSSIKYRQYIKPLVMKKSLPSSSSSPTIKRSKLQSKSGSALLEYNEEPKEYVFYDDVNELVERLIKLDASQSAGNGNHHNEITKILYELHHLGIIEFYK